LPFVQSSKKVVQHQFVSSRIRPHKPIDVHMYTTENNIGDIRFCHRQSKIPQKRRLKIPQ